MPDRSPSNSGKSSRQAGDAIDLTTSFISRGSRVVAASDLIRLNIDQAKERFRKFKKGQLRKDFKRFLTSSDIIGKKGKDKIRIPMPDLKLPRFDYKQGEGKGVGSGEGAEGEQKPGKPGDPKEGSKPGEPGSESAEHGFDAELSIDDVAEILGEELGLPRLKPKQADDLTTIDANYNDISRRGPDSLRHNRRTLRQAMLREISEGTFDPHKGILPVREDFRYKSTKNVPRPKTNAAIIYIMDVSGSMQEEQKEIARIASFWINAWLDHNYNGCEKAFIVHDTQAHEVDEDAFFRMQSNGGTAISPAYAMTEEIIKKRFPPDEWNIYVFQFTDGDNISTDNRLCYDLLREHLLPFVNQFGYAQLPSAWSNAQWSGQFSKGLQHEFEDLEELVIADFTDREKIPDGLKEFLSPGK